MRMLLILIVLSGLLIACAAKPIVATPQEFSPRGMDGQQWKIGGEFLEDDKKLTILVDGKKVMEGKFPPFTPKLTLQENYKQKMVRAECDFIENSVGSGFAASIISSARKRANNSCKVFVGGEEAATLVF